MTTAVSRDVQLAKRPVGMPKDDDFQVVDAPVAAPGPEQIQVRNLCMSVDPYMRGRMVDRKSYVPPFQIGETLTGHAIGVVEASEHPDFAVGDHVESMHGWREAWTDGTTGITNLGPKLDAPASAYLGVLGMPGMTAYVGLLGAGELKDGETLFVSGAAGAVGSIVGQIGKLKGCRVLGSAGSADKVKLLTDELGFDFGFDYHSGNLLNQLREGAPDGLDVYFDNVGAEHLEASIMHMRPFGRIALCGAIAQYNDTEPRPGPNNLAMAIGLGLTLKGFIVSHYENMRSDFQRDMSAWVASGDVKYKETIHDGVDKAGEAFRGLFTGANVGKMVVNV